MMTFAVERLKQDARAALVTHFLALPLKDRSLRFGMALAPTIIASYVDGLDFDRDAVFGVRDERLALAGVAHMAIEDDLAEVALSVLPANRRRGVGSALFKRAVSDARARGMPRLCMHCRAFNAPIMRIADKFGMDLIASDGDAAAYLNLQLTHTQPQHKKQNCLHSDIFLPHSIARLVPDA